MLILIAVALAVIAIFLAVQIISWTTTVSWTPLALPEGGREQEEERELSQPAALPSHPGWGPDQSGSSVLPEAFADLVSEVTLTTKYERISLGPPAAARITRRRKKPKGQREYDGRVTLPQRVYEGTSKIVSVIISPGLWTSVSRGERLMVVTENGQTSFTAVIPDVANALEIELLAAGIEVAGEKKQSKKLTGKVLTFVWNCHFPKKGNYEVALIVKLKTRSGLIDLGDPIKHKLKVVKFFGIPKQIVVIISGASTVATACIGMVKVGRALHWW